LSLKQNAHKKNIEHITVFEADGAKFLVTATDHEVAIFIISAEGFEEALRT
jgi:hypothetical protein